MSERLPKGWVKTTLGEIAEPSRKRALPTEYPAIHYVGLEHIEPQTMRLLGHGYGRDIRSYSVRFSMGDVLYGKMRPYLNKVWVAEFDGICSSEFLVFPKSDHLNSHFLALRLNAEDFVTFANGQVSGERPRVDFKKLSRFSILLPPITEQGRIVAKLNATLSAIQRGELASLRAQERLQRYRSSVLSSAITGELTREWRENQQKSKRTNVETDEARLQRLLAARRTRWEETELLLLRSTGKEPKDDKWKSRYREPIAPDVSDLSKAPKEWIWVSVDQVASGEPGAIQSGPFGSQLLHSEFVDEGILAIGIDNVLDGTFSLGRQHRITPKKYERLRKFTAHPLDVVVTVMATVGRVCVLPLTLEPAIITKHCYRITPAKDWVDSNYLSFALRAEAPTRQHIFGNIRGQTRPGINGTILKAAPVALPPITEQLEIVREVERRLLAADRLAVTLEQHLARAREMRQSLLSEAFTGRLVPQDTNDEHAAALLERLRSERIRLEITRREARFRFRSESKITARDVMNKPLLTPATLVTAFGKIGRKANADLLFKEVGCAPDEVATFYETLSATPEVLAAFEMKEGRGLSKQKAAPPPDKKKSKQKGRFRLVELWLEDFKNLKDYFVKFDSAQGLDVILGWNGTGKSNLFEALVIIFRDLHEWWERNRWPEQPMNGYRLRYEIAEQLVEIVWKPIEMKRPVVTKAARLGKSKNFGEPESITRTDLPLPRFVFGYYSGPTNRLAEHFQPMNQAHYVRLRDAPSDDPQTLATLLEQRRFFCAETHHAKYVLLAFFYKEDPEISNFLKERLRITGFESALFVIRKPRWAKTGAKSNNFWGAKGIMRRVLERLRDFSIAPMVIEQTVSDGYRTTKEDHYYFFLPDLSRLHAFAGEYDNARTFFLALESTDFSELIYDVKIQVRVSSSNAEEVTITFREMSEGEQQLLMVLGLMRFTKSHQSLVLLDEPDTHLNPLWSVDYLKALKKVMSDNSLESPEQQSSQILMATHDPLVIASLVKEQIHLLKRDIESLSCFWEQPSVDPRGLGFTGILTSEMFGFRSDLDAETLELLDEQVDLAGKKELSHEEARKLENITKHVEKLGFKSASSDPYYRAFIKAVVRRQEVRNRLMKPILTKLDFDALQQETDEIIAEIETEETASR